jgi:hypothetical protein
MAMTLDEAGDGERAAEVDDLGPVTDVALVVLRPGAEGGDAAAADRDPGGRWDASTVTILPLMRTRSAGSGLGTQADAENRAAASAAMNRNAAAEATARSPIDFVVIDPAMSSPPPESASGRKIYRLTVPVKNKSGSDLSNIFIINHITRIIRLRPGWGGVEIAIFSVNNRELGGRSRKG